MTTQTSFDSTDTKSVELQDTTFSATVESQRSGRRKAWYYRGGIAIALSAAVAAHFLAPTREGVGLSAVALMLVLMFLRAPLAFALGVPGLLGIYSLNGVEAMASLLRSEPINAASQWSLSVLPMFVLMGLLLWQSGITTKVYDAAKHWLAWMPGGLAVGTNMAGAGLAAVSGSTIGTTYALARIGVPEMLKAGYGKHMAVGPVIVSGLPGQLIPPSIFLVIVAGLLQVPVGPQLIAGVLPGLSVAAIFSITFVLLAIVRPSWVGRDAGNANSAETVRWTQRWRSLGDMWPIGLLIVAMLGGMFFGVFTATEAGAVGALGALVFLLWFQRQNKPMKAIGRAAIETVTSVGAIFLVIMGAYVLGALVSVSGLGRLFVSAVDSAGLGRVEFLILLLVIYLFLGMFMDAMSMMLTTIPFLLPVLNSLEVDLLWFGVFIVFMVELGMLTPPVGVLGFIIHKLLQEPSVNLGQKFALTDVYKTLFILFPVAVLVALLWIFFPEIVTWLPSAMR